MPEDTPGTPSQLRVRTGFWRSSFANGRGVGTWDEAWVHDLAAGGCADDVAYWRGLVEEFRPRRTLELGCATGRLSFPIADAGVAARSDFQLVAVDDNVAYVDRARARLVSGYPRLSGSIRFVAADAAAFASAERFDLIVLAARTLGGLVRSEQRAECLRAVRRHLTENGKVAIDLRVPDLALLAETQRSPYPVLRQQREWIDPAPGVSRFVSFFTITSYDAATQTEATTHYWEIYHADGRHTSMVKDLDWHHYFPCELRALLAWCGLAPVAEYGEYDRTPFSAASAAYRWVMAPA